MIRSLLFHLFDCLPPCQVRIFIRFMQAFDRLPQYGVYDGPMWTAYATATALERAYLDKRFPLYVSMAKSAVLARLPVEAGAERARRIGARRTP